MCYTKCLIQVKLDRDCIPALTGHSFLAKSLQPLVERSVYVQGVLFQLYALKIFQKQDIIEESVRQTTFIKQKSNNFCQKNNFCPTKVVWF